MRRALARFNASTMISSSIRFSLVGAQVLCTTNTSRARTFCCTSTVTSPSENRPTVALPSSTPRLLAISCASAGLALPVNSTVLNSTVRSPSDLKPLGWDERLGEMNLAGEEGLEPSHVGIKIRCLDQLGDSPTQDPVCTEPLKLSQLAQPIRGWWSRLRHILPAHPGGRFSTRSVAKGWPAVPLSSSITLANTALPEPDIRLLPKRISSHRATCVTSGQLASAGGCKSLRPKSQNDPSEAFPER